MRSSTRITALAGIALVFTAIGCSKAADSSADSTAVVAAPDTAAVASAPAPDTAAATSSTASIVKIDLNTATDEEILKIPGVGKKMLREFKEYRPYTSMDQFRREIGKYVDKAEVARLEQYVYIK